MKFVTPILSSSAAVSYGTVGIAIRQKLVTTESFLIASPYLRIWNFLSTEKCSIALFYAISESIIASSHCTTKIVHQIKKGHRHIFSKNIWDIAHLFLIYAWLKSVYLCSSCTSLQLHWLQMVGYTSLLNTIKYKLCLQCKSCWWCWACVRKRGCTWRSKPSHLECL